MRENSAIEWTESTWNPVTGCDRVSPGCAHCYALRTANRLKAMGNPRYQLDGAKRSSGPGFGLTIHRDLLERPKRWKRPRLIFVNSMSDLFHDEVPTSFIQSVFETMVDSRQHTFQVLTKRPERLAALASDLPWPGNIWMGVSVENGRFLNRVELLRQVPAAVRFISAEPLLGSLEELRLEGIDWVIVGGESGPRFRPMRKEWVTDLRDRSVAAQIPFFFKQWGGFTPKAGGRDLDGVQWAEWPQASDRRWHRKLPSTQSDEVRDSCRPTRNSSSRSKSRPPSTRSNS